MKDIIYDIETYVNCFTCSLEFADINASVAFEISDFRDDRDDLYKFLSYLSEKKYRMVGFNNVGFDYPVIHHFIKSGGKCSANDLYQKAMAIINSQDSDSKWQHMVKPSDRYIEQIDLFKIHHFDNRAKSTSLKLLEFNMRMDNIEDLPFPVGSILNQGQIKVLMDYNQHDVKATKLFYHETRKMIEFREELTNKYQRDFMNHNDVKIGTTIFEMELEKNGVQLYEYGVHGRRPMQTKRSVINLNDAILPWIQFERPELQQVLNWLRSQTIKETKGVFKDLKVNLDGFEIVFGLGGLHGSVESEVIESDDEWMIMSSDVASMYPNIGISQRFYPEHLGEKFCDIYQELYERRRNYAKGTAENAMLKLALNGTYGQSNSAFSVFYDALYTMRTTLNGQMFLCLLIENVMKIPDSRMIMANTDGIEVRFKREYKDHYFKICEWWEQVTGLVLEHDEYDKLFIRDCNNYIGVYNE